MQKTILVTGGAGYVGSHVVRMLQATGYKVIVLDVIPYDHYPMPSEVTAVQGDIGDKDLLRRLFITYQVHAVIHCAAYIEVAASLKDPKRYYDNNLFKTGILVEQMLEHGIKYLIFSSSCAVYGIPEVSFMAEDHARRPITPYGKSKHMVEEILADIAHAYHLNFVTLRYFNVAGAEPTYHLGEHHVPETHIIPLLLEAMHTKRPFTLFGNDYETPDGSCIRDFIHVTDVARAHLFALRHIEQGNPSDYFNIGSGHGTSVKQLIKIAEHLGQTSIKVITTERRPGDPAYLVADASKAAHILGWRPAHSSIQHIIGSAYAFMLQQHERARFVNTLW